jgi:tetratricopeptide (TPR) repeat protein
MRSALRPCVFIIAAVSALTGISYGQANNNSPGGDGGNHSIRGRIYSPDGRPLDRSVRVLLQSTTHPERATFSDGNGAFGFSSLTAGTYTVVVDPGEAYQPAQESVFIEPEAKGAGQIAPLPKVRNLHIYLRPKFNGRGARAEVVNAKLAAVPQAAADLYEKAQQAIYKGDAPTAVSHLRQAIGVHPAFSLAWNDLGVLLEKSGETKPAIEAFKSAVKHDPEFFGALLNLGSALAQAGDYKQAETYLAAALTKNPSSFRGHYYMGISQTKLGRLDIAEQAFLQAIKIGGEQTSRAHYLLAGVYWAAKDYHRAADELEKYLAMEPKAADAAKTRQSIAELRKKS